MNGEKMALNKIELMVPKQVISTQGQQHQQISAMLAKEKSKITDCGFTL